ncbi:MAG: DUF1553 domain-containing protein, partial [Limisphaerales bacterium]
HTALKKKISEQETQLKKIETTAHKRFELWKNNLSETNFAAVPKVAFNFENIADKKIVSADGKAEAQLVENPRRVAGRAGQALQFDGENSVVCKGVGDFKRTDPFTFSLWLKPKEKQTRAVVFHHAKAWTDSGSRGYELVLENGKPTFALIHFWPGNAISIRAKKPLPLNEWTHLTMTYVGSSRASDLHIFRDGQPDEIEIVRDNLFKDIIHRAEWGDAEPGKIELVLGARYRDAGFKNGIIDQFKIFERCLTALEVKSNFDRDELHGVPFEKENKDAVELFAFYLNRHDAKYQSALAELKKIREEENQFVNDLREIMVMKELSWRRPTYLLKRGAYDAHGETVEPGTPEGIFPFQKKLPKNRLGLARWLVDKKNPLTARVVVNRIWKMHFGRGLVATPEDFGSQGQLPTHPALLDWLAQNFIAGGWDVKALHKLIVTSATYRQSSVPSPELLAADPENFLLARGPKHRLQAEQIRDEALAVSDLLSPKIGGPSVKPYQPAGLWENSGLNQTYAQDKGEKLYRRSLYTFWRRTSPPPSMLMFDATSREVCTARREATTTPLQSLVLLDDPQFVEAARVLAEKLVREKNEKLDSAIAAATRRTLGRWPETRETKILEQLYEEQLSFFKTNAGAAEKFLATGEHPLDKNLAKDEVAAMTVLVNTLMNHDEFVMKR